MKPALLVLLCVLSGPTAALDLALPVACELGETCYVQNAFDHDPGPGAADWACGTLAYDGHDGTDFALPTLADQAAGVDVLAAAPGEVVGTRDGMEDQPQDGPDAPDIAGRECGNGVSIRHADGWETQYCHMARGSVAVREGDRVEAGAVLGRVGLSGDTQFPHLHLSVRRDGVEVDPFAPDGPPSCGAELPEGMWLGDVAMPQGGLTHAGLATAVPDYGDVRAGTADRPLGSGEPLVIFALLFGGRAGDEVSLVVTGPGGVAVDHREALDRTQALLFRAAGLRAPDGGWPAGLYQGTARLLRDGAQVDRIEVAAELP